MTEHKRKRAELDQNVRICQLFLSVFREVGIILFDVLNVKTLKPSEKQYWCGFIFKLKTSSAIFKIQKWLSNCLCDYKSDVGDAKNTGENEWMKWSKSW